MLHDVIEWSGATKLRYGDRKTPYLHDKNHPINDSKDNWLYEV